MPTKTQAYDATLRARRTSTHSVQRPVHRHADHFTQASKSAPASRQYLPLVAWAAGRQITGELILAWEAYRRQAITGRGLPTLTVSAALVRP